MPNAIKKQLKYLLQIVKYLDNSYAANATNNNL